MTAETPENRKCLNCGARLSGSFCSNCGQKDINLNISFGHLLSDFFGDIFSYDSRVFRTLVPLLCKPGLLTQQYNLGQRVRFVPPVRLFIIISLLYFFFLSLTGVEDDRIIITDAVQTGAGITESVTTSGPRSTTVLADKQKPGESSDAKDLNGSGAANVFVRKVMAASKNREQVAATVFAWMPRVMFMLIPVFAFLLKIFYRKSGKYYVHHLVFSLHFQSFLFLLLFLLLPLSNAFENLTDKIVIIAAPVYLFMSMRRVYAETFMSTLLKCLTLSVSYLFIFTVAMISMIISIIMLQN